MRADHDENKCDERRQAPDELANIRKKHPPGSKDLSLAFAGQHVGGKRGVHKESHDPSAKTQLGWVVVLVLLKLVIPPVLILRDGWNLKTVGILFQHAHSREFNMQRTGFDIAINIMMSTVTNRG